MNKIFCDVLISGAGIVGSTLALRLVQFGFHVIIIDSISQNVSSKKPYPDSRVSAINLFSIELLKKINIWDEIDTYFCIPFHKLEIWECSSTKVFFDSFLLNVPQMGLIVENYRLQSALWKNFSHYKKLNFYYPCCLRSVYYNGYSWELKLSNDKIISTPLLIGADGKNSLVRKKVNIKVTGWQYLQYCMVLNITYTNNQKGTIWQIFTPFGPRGFLPLYNSWGVLMWYDNLDYIHQLQKLPLLILEKKMQKIFGEKLGKIKIYDRNYFPLFCQYAHSYVKEGLALVGDAAHTINPLAGQGINLGLRDVDVLVNILKIFKRNGESWNTLKTLMYYQNMRWIDNFSMQTGINSLYVIFSNDILIMKWIRNISLIFLEHSPTLKKYILKYALGC